MLKSIFKLFKKDFIAYAFADDESKAQMIEYVFKNQRKSSDKFAGWQVSFIDSNGVKYYTPNSDMDIPIKRLSAFMTYNDFLSSGISPLELEQLCDAHDKALEELRIKPTLRNIAKVQVIAEQLRALRFNPVHEDLLFQIAANFYVREDEDPAIIDEAIEKEKYFQLKKDSVDGLYDFFYRTPLKELFDLYGITEDNLTKYLDNSRKQAEMMMKSLKLLVDSSEPKSSVKQES